MNKKTILSASTFTFAILSAFASNKALFDGYSKDIDVFNQETPCKLRKYCDGGAFICKATFTEGGMLYTNVQLYTLFNVSDPTSCIVWATSSDPN